MTQEATVRRKFLGAILLGFVVTVLAAGNGNAGTLIINITDGITSYDIFDQIPPDVNFNLNQIQADTTTLLFPDFNIVGLNASSNNPGENNPAGAVLSVGGHIQRITGGGPATLTITTYQTDFTLPAGAPLSMISTTSSSFSNIPGGASQTFQSWYNPTSPATPPPPFGTPSPLLVLPLAGTSSSSDTNTLGGLPQGASFSLTNQIVITVGGATGSTLPDIVFGGQTQILSAIPEPSSVIMLGTAAPLAVLLLCRLRRNRGHAAA